MARQLRIEFPGAFYHIMSRGNEKQNIYIDRGDRLKFLEYLENASVRYGAIIHCFCLMGNHYHLLLETPLGNLAKIMRHINGSYTTYLNRKHSRVGHLFQGRYLSVLVDADAYFLTLSRYIHQNPVADGLVKKSAEYEWSSYPQYLGVKDPFTWLKTGFVLSMVGDSQEVRKSYKKYVEAEVDVDFADMYLEKFPSMTILGRDEFIEEIKNTYVLTQPVDRDLPATRELRTRPEIQQIIDVVSGEVTTDHRLAKKMSIYLCHHFSGCSLKEIGAYFGVGESAVTQNSRRFAMTLYKDQRLAEMVAGLLAVLKM